LYILVLLVGLICAGACVQHRSYMKPIPISKALEKNNTRASVYSNMLYAEYIMEFGDLEAAETHFSRAAAQSGQVDPWLSLADIQMKRCKTAEAETSLKKAMSIDMSAWYGWLLQSGIETRHHRWQAVADALQTAASLSPEDPYVWYLLAEQEFMLHGPEAAAEVVVGAMEANPDNESLVRFLLRLAILTNNRVLLEGSLETLRMMSVDSFTMLINTVVEEGIKPPAKELRGVFKSQLYTTNPLPGEQLAWAGLLLRWDETTEALAVLQKLYEYDPGDYYASYLIMQVLIRYADTGTIVTWEQAHHKDDRATLYNTILLAEHLYEQGQYDDMLKLLDKLQPQRPGIERDIARLKTKALLKLGKPQKAEAVIKGCLCNATDVPARLLWIWFLSKTGRTEELKQRITAMLEKEPDNYALLFEAIGYAYDADESPWVMAALQQMTERYRTRGAMLNFYGYALAERGENLDEALCLLSEAYTQNHTAAVRDSLAWALFKQGECAMAERMLYLAVERWPEETEIMWHLAQVRMALNMNTDDIMTSVAPEKTDDMSRVSRTSLNAYYHDPATFKATLPVCRTMEQTP